MDYIVNLNPDWEEIEDHEKDDDNILDVRVYNVKTNKEIKDCYVQLYLSKSGMLGLGKSLIRLSNNFHENYQKQLDPLNDKDSAVERMGVWVVPESRTLVVRCEPNFGNLDDEIFSKFNEKSNN